MNQKIKIEIDYTNKIDPVPMSSISALRTKEG
jgi:hypothetical protein